MKKIGIMSLTVMLLLLVAGCKNTEVVPTGLEEEQNTETDSALDTEAETEPEAELMEVPIDNLSVGVDKVTTLEFPAYESGEPVIEMTQDGIVEVLDSYWYDLTLFVKMKGISAGETEMTIEVGAY